MNIGSVPNYTFPSIGQAINMSQNGRITVPVAPSTYIYSQFRHISGVPAQDGVSGVSINKLKILDTLIDQISKMKKDAEPLIDVQNQSGEMHLTKLIEQYQDQVRKIQADGARSPYPPATPLLGMVFNIAA